MSELREVPVLVLVSMIEMERADGRLPHDDAVLREVLVRIHPILVRGSEASTNNEAGPRFHTSAPNWR